MQVFPKAKKTWLILCWPLTIAVSLFGGSFQSSIPPTIRSFNANRATITAGANTTLTGVFANGTGVITPGNIPAKSGTAVTVSPAATTTYTLTVTATNGTAITRSATVTVVLSSTPPFGWVGIIGSGQSLSVGYVTAAISTTQPFNNLKLLDSGPAPQYPVDGSTSAVWSAIPLVEPIRTAVAGYSGLSGYPKYPNNISEKNGSYGETPHSGFANTMSSLWASRGLGRYITAHTISGQGAAPLYEIDKTGRSTTYAAGISEATVYTKLAKQAGTTYGVGGIIFTHGESDSLNTPNPRYEQRLYQLWSDYNNDLKAVTGQTENVVMFASQQSSIVSGLNGPNVQLWHAGIDHQGQIVCTGPKYAYGPNYGLHMFAADYERLGEKYAEVFDAVINRGVNWKPLGPNRVTRNRAVITINFDVPNPPLVWDTNLTPPHQQLNTAWTNGNGFEVTDQSGNEVQIASAAIRGNSVILTLSAVPDPGTNLTLAYALTEDDPTNGRDGGYPNGMHGLLRDSDSFQGYSVETINLSATNGSNLVTGDPAVLARRAGYDIVTGPSVPDGTIVTSISGGQIKLSTPWKGASGTVRLTFRHNQNNYCVHFSMPIP